MFDDLGSFDIVEPFKRMPNVFSEGVPKSLIDVDRNRLLNDLKLTRKKINRFGKEVTRTVENADSSEQMTERRVMLQKLKNELINEGKLTKQNQLPAVYKQYFNPSRRPSSLDTLARVST